jgi:hypothetical protein
MAIDRFTTNRVHAGKWLKLDENKLAKYADLKEIWWPNQMQVTRLIGTTIEFYVMLSVSPEDHNIYAVKNGDVQAAPCRQYELDRWMQVYIGCKLGPETSLPIAECNRRYTTCSFLKDFKTVSSVFSNLISGLEYNI